MMVGGNESVLTAILEFVVKFNSAIVLFGPCTILHVRGGGQEDELSGYEGTDANVGLEWVVACRVECGAEG